MPASSCLLTTWHTAASASRARTAASTASPRSCRTSRSRRAGGRGKLPTWVVRIRCSLRFMGLRLVGQRPVELHLHRALGEAFLLAALAIRGEVRRLSVGVEGGVILVLLVEDEEVGVLRRAVRAIHEAARLGLPDRRHLLLEERRQRIAL